MQSNLNKLLISTFNLQLKRGIKMLNDHRAKAGEELDKTEQQKTTLNSEESSMP